MKIPVIFAVCSMIIGFKAEARGLTKLAAEFLGVNRALDVQKINEEGARIDRELIDASRYWSLFYEGAYEDDSLETSIALSSNPVETITHTLGVTKGSDWGGSFNFSNSYTSLTGSNFFGTLNGGVYEFSQSVSYTQDLGKNFLGQNDKREIKEAELAYQLQKIITDSEKESGLLRVANAYADASLSLALLELQRQAFVRAQRRERLVERRVRDGLKERVDLYQARVSRELQNEEMRNAEISLHSALERIGSELHREVSKEEVIAYDFGPAKALSLPEGSGMENIQIKTLETRLNILESEYKRRDSSLLPEIALTGSYTSNAFDRRKSEVFETGKLGGPTNETRVALSLVWPLGSRPAKLERSKVKIEKELTRKTKEKLAKNVKVTENFFEKQLKLIGQNLVSGKKRRDLATRALSEFNKLYNRGRADLDQVIRAEEDLIGTEKQYVRSLSDRKKVLFQLAFLYGSLADFCMKIEE